MSSVRLSGNAGGTGIFTIESPNSNNSRTVSIPDGTGTMVVNNVNSAIVSDTVKSATGTAVDFTSIPSWVKRITVMFNDVSTNGTSNPIIQVGSGSFNTTGYIASSSVASATGSTAYTTGFGILSGLATNTVNGSIVLVNQASNTWVASGVLTLAGANTCTAAGRINLSGILDRVRITTVNGTDTFDLGSINILYE